MASSPDSVEQLNIRPYTQLLVFNNESHTEIDVNKLGQAH